MNTQLKVCSMINYVYIEKKEKSLSNKERYSLTLLVSDKLLEKIKAYEPDIVKVAKIFESPDERLASYTHSIKCITTYEPVLVDAKCNKLEPNKFYSGCIANVSFVMKEVEIKTDNGKKLKKPVCFFNGVQLVKDSDPLYEPKEIFTDFFDDKDALSD